MKPIITQISEAIQEAESFKPHWTSSNGKRYFTIDDVVRDGIDPKELKKVSRPSIDEILYGRKITTGKELTASELRVFLKAAKLAHSQANKSKGYAMKAEGLLLRNVQSDD